MYNEIEGLSIIMRKIITKPCDFLILILFLCVIVHYFSMIFTGDSKLLAEVSYGDEVYEYDLNQNKSFSVKGNLGETHIAIQDGEVMITASPCENKICVHQGKISKAGQWLCCAPNQIIVVLKGQDSENSLKADAISF